MDSKIFVSSFRLNVEVRIAGGLIWDAIEKISNVNRLPQLIFPDSEPYYTEDCYMCLYNASQGIERLQKTLIELYMHKIKSNPMDNKDLHKLLMSHNHKKINEYIDKNIVKIPKRFVRLVNDLSLFYNEIRYNNFNFDKDSKYNRTYFYNILCNYEDNIQNKNSVSIVQLESFKYNFASLLGGYSLFLYDQIADISTELNVYTYELSGNTKSTIVFSRDKNDNLYTVFLKYRNAKKEVLYSLASKGKKMLVDKFKIRSLEIDDSSIMTFCRQIIDNSGFDYFDEIDFLYDEICDEDKKEFKNRLSFIKYIFSPDSDNFDF